jgi:hypothetical protein
MANISKPRFSKSLTRLLNHDYIYTKRLNKGGIAIIGKIKNEPISITSFLQDDIRVILIFWQE